MVTNNVKIYCTIDNAAAQVIQLFPFFDFYSLLHFPPEWADGLQSDILNNISRDFKEEPAYDLYVSMVCNGIDPP